MSSIDINESGRPLAPTEISYIARHVTYPQLRDHPSVEGRDAVLGLAANVVFVNHTYLENQADHGLQHSRRVLYPHFPCGPPGGWVERERVT